MAREGFNKGEYEDAVEQVRACMQQGYSMRQMVQQTNLSQEQIGNIKRKLEMKNEKEYNDPNFR
ncbi:hypothetical protein [Clostridium sp. DL1XJH146]